MAFRKKKNLQKKKTRKNSHKKNVRRTRSLFRVSKGGSINHLLNCTAGICPAYFT